MRRAAALLAASLATGAAAEAPRWHLQVDNDVVFHTDRWYSSGVRLSRSAPLDAGSPAASLLRLPGTTQQHWELGLVHEIYTSDGNATPGPPDRPDAARLFLSLARHDRSPWTWTTLAVEAGVTGPSAQGERAQDLIHALVPAPHTDWSRQVGDRADAHAIAAWSRRWFPAGVPGALAVHAGGVAGTIQRFAHAGLAWRWGAAVDQASPLLRFSPTPALAGPSRGLGLFAGASVRAVGANRLLDRRGDDPTPRVAAERRVRRVAAGLSWAAAWGTVDFSLAQDSREFAGQPHPHRFGSLTVSFDLP